MPRNQAVWSICLFACLAIQTAARGQTFQVLYAFQGGNDGSAPYGALLLDKYGNLYGTTSQGGNGTCSEDGCGTVFEIASNGQEKVLHAFTGDGDQPMAGLIEREGTLYGTTEFGGSGNCSNVGTAGCGTVFALVPGGSFNVVHNFAGKLGNDGFWPGTSLTAEHDGYLYGTTYKGGHGGGGTIFRVAENGTNESVLFWFNVRDGSGPGNLTKDAANNLYGTTYGGGGNQCGTVFKLAPDGTMTNLYTFLGGQDACGPMGGVIQDGAGNLYGTTISPRGGTVFKLSPAGVETLLHVFGGSGDGSEPYSGLTTDAAGDLYGTTTGGGASGCGTVFKIAPDGSETVVYSFTCGADGGFPVAGLIKDKSGNLYGTALYWGANMHGTVFRITP